MPLTVMTIVGTRPELIKLSRVIAELDLHLRHVLVHSGQNYDYALNGIFFDQLGIRKPDFFLQAAGATAAATIGNVIRRADELMAKQKPDALLLLGDTNSCLAAIAAKRRRIPVFHMEAGNRCFDYRVPEEINRKIVDHVSDVNLTYTEHARRHLLAEGLRPDTVIKTGSPMREVLEHYLPKIGRSGVLKKLKLKPKGYFVVSAHREENVDDKDALENLLHALAAIRKTWKLPLIFSTHPRTRKRFAESRARVPGGVRLIDPLGFLDYIKLQMHARCVVSDSGTVTEEASLLGFPAVTIREAHERPEGMDQGILVMCGLEPTHVVDAIRTVLDQHDAGYRPRPIADYDVPDVSKKIVRIILSYTDYVNRTVWGRKPLRTDGP